MSQTRKLEIVSGKQKTFDASNGKSSESSVACSIMSRVKVKLSSLAAFTA